MNELDAPVRADDTLCLPLEIKAASGEGVTPGTFEGYGSIFGNRDRDGDIVAPGAFAESLKKGLPALLWQHDQKAPIGRFDIVKEDKRGLYVKGRLAMSGRGKEAYDLLKMGALNGLSIGFVSQEASRDRLSGARTIHKANLMEVSLVTFPANEMARVADVKSSSLSSTIFDGDDISDARSFERMLRENGFSRSRAKAITAKGFVWGTGQSADLEIEMLISDLKTRQARITGDCHADCMECEPCRKGFNGAPSCDWRLNDIVHGNRTRWAAWSELDRETRKMSSLARKLGSKQKEKHILDLVSAITELLQETNGVQRIFKGIRSALYPTRGIAGAIADASSSLIALAKMPFDTEVDRLIKSIQAQKVKIERLRQKVDDLEDMFRKQVKAYEKAGCSGLTSRHFNKP